MKLSLIISSYNQKTRLKYCLQSAIKQKLRYATNLEIIVADDNSEDGTDEMLTEFNNIKVIKSKYSKKEKYTLAGNWNNAVLNHATGDRIIFTNGDHIFSSYFADEHANPEMQEHIIFGPSYQTCPDIEKYLNNNNTYKDLITICSAEQLLLPDRHLDKCANTYNVEWSYLQPYGYNFSVKRNHFIEVGGFPFLEEWGGEETELCKKIVKKYNCKVLSNNKSVIVHLWHPVVNHTKLYGGNNYRF